MSKNKITLDGVEYGLAYPFKALCDHEQNGYGLTDSGMNWLVSMLQVGIKYGNNEKTLTQQQIKDVIEVSELTSLVETVSRCLEYALAGGKKKAEEGKKTDSPSA